MPPGTRNRPAGTEAALGDLAGELIFTNGTAESNAASYFRNSYAVLVRGKSVRRHLYFNLPAADRAVKRALARGDKADLILVRLVPVDARQLDQIEVGN
jgi:hypothetical protein